MAPATSDARHHVVIIGSGFGGLFATKALRRAPVRVTLIDRTTQHLFQPLLYQVATGILSEGEIAPPVREVLRRQQNVRVVLGEVTSVDLKRQDVDVVTAGTKRSVAYDSLIVAAGAGQSYFGHDEFEQFAPGMKSLDDAIALRGRIFNAFELAELEEDEARRRPLLTFVVVGAGPTGVEMAGQLLELARRSMRRNFRSIDPAQARVVLVEAGPRVLPTFGDRLSDRAAADLRRLGIELRLASSVVDVDADGVDIADAAGRSRVDSATVIWAAGVSASPLGGLLAHATGATLSRSGQLVVGSDLTLPDHPEVFVVGDMMRLGAVPGDAQAAIQSGRFAARRIEARVRGRESQDVFVYRDHGRLATISRFRAIASVRRLRLSGGVAWLLWLAVHLIKLVGFKNRLSVLMHWSVSFIGRSRSERTAPFGERSPSTTTSGEAQSFDASDVDRGDAILLVQTASTSSKRSDLMSEGTNPVLFIHGLWLHATSWAPWMDKFAAAGYEPTAPGWPGVPDTVDAARANSDSIADKGIDDVVEHYRAIIEAMPARPVLVGHSFGGMIAEKLLGMDLGIAAVAIDAAQIKGVLPLPLSALHSTLPVFKNPANKHKAVSLSSKQFRYGFGNAVTEDESDRLYEQWAIPAPGKPLFEAAAANFSLHSPSKVATDNAERGPLLLVMGGRDHTVPEAITKSTLKQYRKSPAVTELIEFPDRGHSLTIDSGWEEVADASLEWLTAVGVGPGARVASIS